jgi:peroxiredoxin
MQTILINLLLGTILLTDPSGLQVGQKAPDFTGVDQNGNRIDLYETLKSKKVILTFYRGAWCRYCMGQFKDYQDSIQQFDNKNAVLFAISPEQEDGIQKTAKTTKASFSLIHDEGLEIMQAYEVISQAKYAEFHKEFTVTKIDNQHKYLPVPATYIIDQDGSIEYVYFDPNYKVRATVNDLLDHL